MRMRKKKNQDVRLARCEEVIVHAPELLRGRWLELLPDAHAVRLEIGCGKGRFINAMAAANPDTLFIAIEREEGALVMAAEKTCAMDLKNVYYIAGDAQNLPVYFSPGEVERLYLNFSDPWPSNRHAKRRLTHESFVTLYRQVLPAGGTIEFKTDNDELFAFSLESLPACGLTLQNVTHDLHATDMPNIMTEYEERFSGMGVKIKRLEAILP